MGAMISNAKQCVLRRDSDMQHRARNTEHATQSTQHCAVRTLTDNRQKDSVDAHPAWMHPTESLHLDYNTLREL